VAFKQALSIAESSKLSALLKRNQDLYPTRNHPRAHNEPLCEAVIGLKTALRNKLQSIFGRFLDGEDGPHFKFDINKSGSKN
jgi:hypothetical protein